MGRRWSWVGHVSLSILLEAPATDGSGRGTTWIFQERSRIRHLSSSLMSMSRPLYHDSYVKQGGRGNFQQAFKMHDPNNNSDNYGQPKNFLSMVDSNI